MTLQRSSFDDYLYSTVDGLIDFVIIETELRSMKQIYTFLCLFLLSGIAFSDVTGKAYVTDGDTVRKL